ncbi:MAG: hypothetical protein FJ206_14700 [Gemmatimonadetes bacterium]|nr:hypothetical protein [Gemmatimonadota bacterium]
MAIWRKVRAVLAMGAVWALGWVPIGVVTNLVLSLANGWWPPVRLLVEVVRQGAISGALSGMLFGTLLALTEHRRTVAQLSARRVGALGVLSGIVPTGLIVLVIMRRFPNDALVAQLAQVMAICGLIGAASAGTVLYLARRAPRLPDEPDRRELADRDPRGSV